jgi:hypothetical protein
MQLRIETTLSLWLPRYGHSTAAKAKRARMALKNRDTLQKLVGRAPISAAEFARRHAAAFTPQVAS